MIDVRELISVNEVFEASQEGSEVIGPNGALLYCMEHLIENIDWLSDRLVMNSYSYKAVREWSSQDIKPNICFIQKPRKFIKTFSTGVGINTKYQLLFHKN